MQSQSSVIPLMNLHFYKPGAVAQHDTSVIAAVNVGLGAIAF